MSNLLNVSPSPHLFGKETTRKLMFGVILALVPAMIASLYFFGWGAIIVTLTSVASCVFFEYIIQKFILKTSPSITDGSAVITGVLLAFNVPSNLPVFIIIIGALVSIGIAKMTFGGLGNNPFNPALVGRVFLLISFPVQMTRWPLPTGFSNSYTDAVTGATPLGILKEGLNNGESMLSLMDQIPSHLQLFYGQMGGSMGEIAAVALLLGFAWLLYKKIITWHIPVAVIGSVALFTSVLWIINPEKNADPLFHVLTGGVLIGAIFMATDYVTSPMSKRAMIIYGIGIGVLTVIIRVYGSYPEGVSFAILIMNAFVPLMNFYIKPKNPGKVKING
jgi:electron transport complex protein RnfD